MEVRTTAIREEKEIKGIEVGKEEVKLSLSADDMILYTENGKDATRKLLELVDEFSKVAGYKINIQKSAAFLYINNEQKKKLRKQSHLQLHQKEYLGINLQRKAKDLYLKNCKTLIKETEGDTDGKIYGVLGLEE